MTDMNFDPDADVDAGDPTAWEPVKRGERRRPVGMVLSVRLTPDLASGLQAVATSLGTTVSEAARRLLSEAVGNMWQQRNVTIRIVEGRSTTVSHGNLTVGGTSKLRALDEVLTPAS